MQIRNFNYRCINSTTLLYYYNYYFYLFTLLLLENKCMYNGNIIYYFNLRDNRTEH